MAFAVPWESTVTAREGRSNSGEDLDAKPEDACRRPDEQKRGVHRLVRADARAVPSPRDALHQGIVR
jgi:hypothetical protein